MLKVDFRWSLIALLALLPIAATAAEPLSLQNVTKPEKNRRDEPLAEKFSVDAAAHFLDTASLDWLKRRRCFTCHTNYSYLLARPVVSHKVKAHQQIRTALEDLVQKTWPDEGPRWDAEVVMAATVLAHNDAATTGKLHAATGEALDRMWSVKRPDGGFNWLKCGWPPMESDDHYGATMAAIAVGVAPGDYAQTDKARRGLKKLQKYFGDNPPPTAHHRAMLLWASTHTDGILTKKQQTKTVEELLSLQGKDGGWALAALGDWKRSDKKEQDKTTSDGYGTGFVVYVLRRADVSADDPRIEKAIVWLKKNQRQSGRWFTRSLNKDNHHFISHAGSAFALMALAECGQLGK